MRRTVSRRTVLKTALSAGAASFALHAPAIAQGAGGRVVVVGGGFGGASCARALKQANPALSVTLVESNATYTACPFTQMR